MSGERCEEMALPVDGLECSSYQSMILRYRSVVLTYIQLHCTIKISLTIFIESEWCKHISKTLLSIVFAEKYNSCYWTVNGIKYDEMETKPSFAMLS